jgi:glycosyltransferase involved in cell wall biosynthesis
VNAFREYVSQEQEPDIHLVLAGGLGQSLEEVCERLDLKQADLDRVQFTGFVPDEDLAPLYSGAEAFVFPSLYEGFGLPVLEAMQCGCPVIASNTASIPEVAGEAAILIDPYDEEDLSASISKVRTDPKTRRRMSTLGIEQARKYSWSKRMETVLGVYDQII